MPLKPIADTNRYLKDSHQRECLLKKSVTTSTAIEGIQVSLREPGPNKSRVKRPRRHRRRIR